MLTALLLSGLIAAPNGLCPEENWRVLVAYEQVDDSIAYKEFLACSRPEADTLASAIDEHGFWLEPDRITLINHGSLRQIQVAQLR